MTSSWDPSPERGPARLSVKYDRTGGARILWTRVSSRIRALVAWPHGEGREQGPYGTADRGGDDAGLGAIASRRPATDLGAGRRAHRCEVRGARSAWPGGRNPRVRHSRRLRRAAPAHRRTPRGPRNPGPAHHRGADHPDPRHFEGSGLRWLPTEPPAHAFLPWRDRKSGREGVREHPPHREAR